MWQKIVIIFVLVFGIASCSKDDERENKGTFYLSNEVKDSLPYKTTGEKFTYKSDNGKEIVLTTDIKKSIESFRYTNNSYPKYDYQYEQINVELVSNDSSGIGFVYNIEASTDNSSNIRIDYVFNKTTYCNFNNRYYGYYDYYNGTIALVYYKENPKIIVYGKYKTLSLKGKTYKLVSYNANYDEIIEKKEGINYIVIKKTKEVYDNSTKGIFAFKMPNDTSLYVLTEK